MRLNVDQQMKSLLTKEESFWRNLLNQYLVKVSSYDFFQFNYFQNFSNNVVQNYSQSES